MINDPMESAREQQREQQRQTQAQQRQQVEARQQSQALQQQMEHQQRESQQQQQQHQAQERKANGLKEAAQQDAQRKKRETEQQRNRTESMKRQSRDDGPTESQPASKNAAIPPGPAPMAPELKPSSAALLQASKDDQVREAQNLAVKQVLSEKPENAPNKDAHKAAEKPVTTKQAAQLMDVASRLGISSKELLQKTGETQAPPSRQEISAAIHTAEKIGTIRPEVMGKLKAAEKEALPAPERVKQQEQERGMSR